MTENIKIPNSYFERVNTPTFQSMMKKDIFKEVKARYWLGKALDRVEQESRRYFKEKQKLITQYAKKHTKAGKEERNGQMIKRWNKGDPITLPSGEPDWENFDAFVKDLGELQEIEIDLGMKKVEFTDPPDLPVGEIMLILPLIEEKEK